MPGAAGHRVIRPHSGGALLALAALLAATGLAAAPPPRLAQRSWWDRAPAAWSKHYLVKTDLPLAVARAYGRHLDRMYEEYSRRLASLPPRGPEKLNVYLFARKQEYLQTLRARWGVDADGSGGIFFVNPTGSGLALWTEGLPPRRICSVMQHEGFHQFAYSRFGDDLPEWVNEGLAEFFGRSLLVGDRFVLGQATSVQVQAVQDLIERHETVPFRRLLAMSNAEWSDQVKQGRADALYNQSWSMVHFLAYGDGARYQQPFERYLRLLNSGVPSPTAFARVFGDETEAFEARWREYALAARPTAFVTTLDRIEFLARGAFELSRRGIVPGDLDEMKQALRVIEFSADLDDVDPPLRISARDDHAFEIPGATEGDEDGPAFVVSAPVRVGLTRREVEMERKQPTPAVIETRHLAPCDLAVRWSRDETSGRLSYEITVR